MLTTRMNKMLGIKHPIIQGGMQWLANAEFAAAVSNAGALGIINALSFATAEDLRAEIRKLKSLTDNPFGVNVSMLPGFGSDDLYRNYFRVIVEEEVKIVETSGRNPEPFLPPLKEAGVIDIHKVPGVRYAQKAEKVGADMTTLVGFECGGHPGMDDVTSLILVQKAAGLLNIPVLAGGGFGTGRALAAALALGAEGIVMGTRFMATKECPLHDNFKNWIVNAQETDTVIIDRSIRNPARVRNNAAAQQVLELEKKGATLTDLMPIIAGAVGKEAYLSGNLDKGVVACGQVIGLVDRIPSVKELIEGIVHEAEEVLRSLSQKLT